MQSKWDVVVDQMKQPSTWRGIISVITAAGIVVTPAQSAAIIAGGMALMGLINVFRKEINEGKVIPSGTVAD